METNNTKFRWLSTQTLVNDFKENSVTESLAFKYVLAEFLLLMLATSLSIQSPPEEVGMWFITTVVFMLLVAVGTYWCFLANKAGDNQDFTLRYVAFNFVVSMQFAVGYGALLIGMIVFFPLLENTAFMSESGIDPILNISLMTAALGLYYFLIARHIKSASTKDVVEE